MVRAQLGKAVDRQLATRRYESKQRNTALKRCLHTYNVRDDGRFTPCALCAADERIRAAIRA